MKILIAVPTFENIYPDTFKSIYGLDGGEHDLMFDFIRGYDVATARNKIAKKALEYDVDYVLMVDNDVVLPEKALDYLLDDPKQVCLGYYAHREPDNIYKGRMCICKFGWWSYPAESEYTAQELLELRNAGNYKVEIRGGGAGCAFISTGVFRQLEYPYYKWVDNGDGTFLSEDLYFCEQCRAKKIPVYTDTRLGCGHILRHIQWPV